LITFIFCFKIFKEFLGWVIFCIHLKLSLKSNLYCGQLYLDKGKWSVILMYSLFSYKYVAPLCYPIW
jgi:hypothetical protein